MFILQMPPTQPTPPRLLILPGTIGGPGGMFEFRPRPSSTSSTSTTTTTTTTTTPSSRPPILMTDAQGGMQRGFSNVLRLIGSIFD